MARSRCHRSKQSFSKRVSYGPLWRDLPNSMLCYMSFMSPTVTSIRGNCRTCRLRSIFTNKYEGFCGTLWSYYGEELRRNYVFPTVDIRKGVAYELYFLLTFKESPYAYLLTMSEFATWSDNKDVFYGNLDGLSLALPLKNQYTFDILFQGVNVANVNQGRPNTSRHEILG